MTASTSGDPIDNARFERACEWFLELREKSESFETVAEWLAWCRADPLNRQAFERARSVWQVTGEVRPEDLALVSLPRAEQRVVQTRRVASFRRPNLVIGAALAAGLAAVLLNLAPPASWNVTRNMATVATYQTQPGENRANRLADGSTVILGGGSSVVTAFDEDARRLTLERGEAYFQVKHDRERPFIVTAGDFRVTAVGTAFNVRTDANRVVVTVAEGMVSIDPPPDVRKPSPGDVIAKIDDQRSLAGVLRDTLRASAGQEVILDTAEQQLQMTRVEPHAVASWQSGRLEFVREPLPAVLSSVNRYSGRQLRLDDPALGDLRFTGTVFADRVDDWIHGLPAVFPVRVREEGANVVIEARDRSDHADATAN